MLEWLRLRLATSEALWVMTLLGAAAGISAGLVIVAFRLLIDWGQLWFTGEPGDFEQLDPLFRLGLVVTGAVLVGLVFQRLGDKTSVGVVHVIERLAYHHGQMPLRNAVLQFFAGAACIISGQSVGREGPAVHLGAASASNIGYRMGLPNNSLLVLVACGTAASISASFDTPLAGVIFAMEVVMMEYSIAGFTPVLVASVSAALVTQWAYGHGVAFHVPTLSIGTNWEMALLLVMALILGALSALFIGSVQQVVRWGRNIPVVVRFGLAGLATGLIAWLMPEVMGIGYDSVNHTLLGHYALGALLALLAAKLVATTLAIGFGLPGGVIGPTLVMGAAVGGAMGMLATWLYGDSAASPGFYALLGMVGMMSATLQAPLAALTAMLELSGNLNIILPGMLVVVGANLVVSEVFHKRSIFRMLLRERGLDYAPDAITRHLRSIGVTRVMDRRFVRVDAQASLAELQAVLEGHPLWLVVEVDEHPVRLLAAADLERQLAELVDGMEEESAENKADAGELPPALSPELAQQGLRSGLIEARANMHEALLALQGEHVDALAVTKGLRKPAVEGILTRAEIDQQYTRSEG